MKQGKEELEKEAEAYSYKLYHSRAWNPGKKDFEWSEE